MAAGPRRIRCSDGRRILDTALSREVRLCLAHHDQYFRVENKAVVDSLTPHGQRLVEYVVDGDLGHAVSTRFERIDGGLPGWYRRAALIISCGA
jgi:hypothetical protein